MLLGDKKVQGIAIGSMCNFLTKKCQSFAIFILIFYKCQGISFYLAFSPTNGLSQKKGKFIQGFPSFPFQAILSWKCWRHVMLPDPPKRHVVCRHADMSWKCLESRPDMSSDSVVWTMPDDMTCRVETTSADMSADSF